MMREGGEVREVMVEADGRELPGLLGVPSDARAMVVFAHGSGSSRLSRRNNRVAEVLREAGLATLLLDLLTEAESTDRGNVFDIGLLARRLGGAGAWVRAQEGGLSELEIGYFGASTGAAAALVSAAADRRIGAVVSRGGRPDLAGDALERVVAPTLLIVGGADEPVIPLNESALGRLGCEKRLEVVEGATHLFEEPGALERVSALARDWLVGHLGAGGG